MLELRAVFPRGFKALYSCGIPASRLFFAKLGRTLYLSGFLDSLCYFWQTVFGRNAIQRARHASKLIYPRRMLSKVLRNSVTLPSQKKRKPDAATRSEQRSLSEFELRAMRFWYRFITAEPIKREVFIQKEVDGEGPVQEEVEIEYYDVTGNPLSPAVDKLFVRDCYAGLYSGAFSSDVRVPIKSSAVSQDQA